MSDVDPTIEGFSQLPPLKELTKPQRRVLGTLVEKGFTVPESYPLTLKAATTGCNQKNNRSPVTSYTEDAVLDALEELRKLGVAAVVHTESGRTERYRHYVRKRFPFSEAQLAIMTELWLRGRQQLGELRTRASRMAPIESQQHLRQELDQLLAQGYVQADGSLDRRGAEVDHTFYLANEPQRSISASPRATAGDDDDSETTVPAATARPVATNSGESSGLRQVCEELRAELAEVREEVSELRESLAELRRNLGA